MQCMSNLELAELRRKVGVLKLRFEKLKIAAGATRCVGLPDIRIREHVDGGNDDCAAQRNAKRAAAAWRLGGSGGT